MHKTFCRRQVNLITWATPLIPQTSIWHHAYKWTPHHSYTTSYWWLILTYFLSCTISKLWLIIGQLFTTRGQCLNLMLSLGWSPANIAINDLSLKHYIFGLHFRCRKYWCIFNHFYVIRPKRYQIRQNYAAVRAITPFKVIQGHQVWYQSKAHMRLPVNDWY